MALDKFVLAELALGIDAFEADRNWDRRELVGRARSREVWECSLCIRAYRKCKGCSRG